MKIITVTAVLSLLILVTDSQLCSNKPTVGPNDPRLPQLLPSRFQVSIEAAILDRGLSISAVEYFDQNAGRSALIFRQDGYTESIYVNVNTNESYHIVGDNCTVSDQASDIDDAFMGGQAGGKNVPHTYSTAAAIRFAQTYGEVYLGMTVIRGVVVDHWQSCMYWDFLGVNFTLDYYFSASNWSTSDGSFQLPVRAEVQGYNNLVGPGPASSFHHIYDYVGFKSSIDDITNLETPKGIVCLGRKHTRPMPQLNQQYQYRQEITVPGEEIVMNIDVWYDYGYKLLRYDYRPTALAYPYYSLDTISEIHDFNTGVAYLIDQTFLNCTVVPIENSTWDATRNMTQQHIAIGMKSPEQLFYLDPTYAYSGQRRVRSIQCDVFSTIRTDFPDNGLLGKKVIFEVYFMAKGWTSDNDIGANTQSSDIPVRLEISESTSGYYVKYDFFDFDQEHPFLSSFDITQCYTDQDQIRFQITFPGNYNVFLLQYKNILEQFSLLQLAQTSLLSPLRLQHLDVHWDNQHAYLQATIMDISPALARYRRWPQLVASYRDDVILNISDPRICASACSIQQKAICNSFDVCPKAGTCALSLNYTSDGKKLHASDTCDHFSRVITGTVTLEVGLVQAYNLLANAVNSGKFGFHIQVPVLGIDQIFQSSAITQISYGPATTSSSAKSNPPNLASKTTGKQTVTGSAGPSVKPTTKQHQNTNKVTSKPPTPKPLCTNNGQQSNNAGVIVGVALAMLALGIILGIAAMVAYQKRQERLTATHLDVSYVKNPNFNE